MNNKTRFISDDCTESDNDTVIRQTYHKLGSDVTASLLSSEIIATGYNKVGRSIPTFADVNVLSGALDRLYGTSDFAKKAVGNIEQASIDDFGSIDAFWDSWGATRI